MVATTIGMRLQVRLPPRISRESMLAVSLFRQKNNRIDFSLRTCRSTVYRGSDIGGARNTLSNMLPLLRYVRSPSNKKVLQYL